MSAQFLAKPQRFIVEPAPGWSDITLEEARAILARPTQKYKFQPDAQLEDGAVVVSECDFRQAMELTMRVTTAHDVRWVAVSKRILAKADWDLLVEASGILALLPEGQPVHLGVRISHPVAGTEKDVKELLKRKFSAAGLTWADDQRDALQDIYIESLKNRTRMLVSMGGVALFKRGYKSGLSAAAPLAEHHAAAAFRWLSAESGEALPPLPESRVSPLIVPFAGTGTLGFEALSQACDVSPAEFRKEFGFEAWRGVPAATAATIRKRLSAARSAEKCRVVFGDINEDFVGRLRLSAEEFLSRSKISAQVEVLVNDFIKEPGAMVAEMGGCALLLNPPYGLRLAKGVNTSAFYAQLGRVIADLGARTPVRGYVLCPDEESWSSISKPLRRFKLKTRHFSHGGLDIRCLVFT